MKFNEKLKQLIKDKCVSMYRVGQDTGIPKQSIMRYANGTQNPNGMNAHLLAKYFNVSVEYLMDETDGINQQKSEDRERKTISVPQTAISETKRKGALIYDIDGTCGSDGRSIEFTDERVIGSIDVPGISPNSQIIFATGDSMQPLIYSGDRIVIRKIESWDYFNYGQVHLIITNEHRFIKRIRKHPEDEGSLILLRSENPEFDDIPLPKKEIVHLYIVENILSIKNVL